MTEIQVPQVSLWRYVDLLKRRRWQVIPVSLVGLVVGALVAFFWPRYYQAETLLVHRQVPGQDLSRDVDDPFRAIVDNAILTIPQATLPAMKQLGWAEALVEDPYQLNQNVRVVSERIWAKDENKYEAKDRTYAQIKITYRDRDGLRAANFLNTLVEVWSQENVEAMRAPVEEERNRAVDEGKRLDKVYDDLLDEKYRIESDYQIAPDLEASVQRSLLAEREKEAKGVRDDQVKQEALRVVAQQKVDLEREKLAQIQRRVAPDPQLWAKEAAKTPAGQLLLAQINAAQQKKTGFYEWTGEYAEADRTIRQCEAMLQILVGPSPADAEGLIENPAWAEQQKLVREAEMVLAQIDAEIAGLAKRVADTREGMARLAEGLKRYQKKLTDIAKTEQDRTLASDRLRNARDVLAKLGNQRTIEQKVRATVPPRPTEPNILIVAMIACVLGLGVAIALILLLDLLQGSFKTVDDVERGLAVPVLGGMSHLETSAERDRGVRNRRRVTLVAATFVFLVVVVVTIYYVDPTRLPPFVRDLLGLLLGT